MKTTSLTLLFLLLLNISLYAKNIESLEVDELESYIQKRIIVIDIREKEQWDKTGIVPSSYRLTFLDSKRTNNKQKWQNTLIRLIKEKSRAFVLISEDGKKAENLAKILFDEKKLTNVMYLKGGINSWIGAHRRVINF